MKIEKIISPIDPQLLEKELTPDLFVRKTNKGRNEIYIFTHDQAPNLMREVGRLRELSFRDAGGGTGKSIDIDKYDTSEIPFKQLIVWDPEGKAIIGGYRFILGKDNKRDQNNMPITPTSGLFEISEEFKNNYWNQTIELGRSFVQPAYQPSVNRKGIFSLDNLWDGLGTIVVDNPDMKYFFGKFTIYPSYNIKARDIVYYFLNKYFPDPDKLITPKYPIHLETDEKELHSYFKWNNYNEDYRTLLKTLRDLGEYIPPLVNAYMNLSTTMRIFGTSLNSHFGNVYETGMLIIIDDIFEDKKKRYIDSYIKMKS